LKFVVSVFIDDLVLFLTLSCSWAICGSQGWIQAWADEVDASLTKRCGCKQSASDTRGAIT